MHFHTLIEVGMAKPSSSTCTILEMCHMSCRKTQFSQPLYSSILLVLRAFQVHRYNLLSLLFFFVIVC